MSPVSQRLDYSYQRAAGTSVLVAMLPDQRGALTPVVLHWGADLGELDDDDVAVLVDACTLRIPNSALDAPRWLGILPENAAGFTGTPGVEILRAEPALAWAPRFRDWRMADAGTGKGSRFTAADDESGVEVSVLVELTDEGLVRLQSTLTNTGSDDVVVSSLRSVLPVGAEAAEILDLTGRWTRERAPQRSPFRQGTWARSGHHGRTGHDATLLMVAGSPAFTFRTGTVWGIHLAWSGDTVHYAERTAEGEALLGAHELLGPGEVILSPGAAYTSPWLFGSWSDAGLDGMSARLHSWQRRRVRRPRPVLVNTWEAVYFDHDLERLTVLAEAAKEIGAERFVLDDGWFRGRRDDHAGLGDWTVDPAVWPDGLHPLVDRVHALGMDFGLWVEPEMVNMDSDLARAHPDWVLKGRSELPPEWRFQQVLDLANPEAFEYLKNALLSLLDEYDIAFLKWDHNRDLVDVAHAGRPAVRGQVLALYRLLDILRSEHPDLEIETCASGGGRTDLGILERTDRLWASDTIDALERQQIQRWTTLLFPPEVMGAHVGSPVAHTTGRNHRLSFRAATALIGHYGVEWDVTQASPAERSALAKWTAVYKQVRGLVATGTLVRGEHPDSAILVTGVVAPDLSEAVYVVATVTTTSTQSPLPVRLPGLDAGRRYVVADIGVPDPDVDDAAQRPPAAGLTLPGGVLTRAGIQFPPQLPESARVLHCRLAREDRH
jgi:alpha-galactosidase